MPKQIPKNIQQLIDEKQGIKLELGGGDNPNPGFVNIDILPLPKVDIVWDLERTPWPLPDECALQVVASHVLEHINPHSGDKRLQGLVELLVAKKVFTIDEANEYMGLPGPAFINVMNEIWRVLKPKGQFAAVVPHAESHGYAQDPTHISMINETTYHYFDPDPEGANIGQQLYGFYRPKPFKIVRQYFNQQGNLEILLEKRLMDKSYLGDIPPTDITKEKR